MLATRHLYFVFMTLAAAVATACVLNFMLEFKIAAAVPSADHLLQASSVLLIPFGAALWISPKARIALEATCTGLLLGLLFFAYTLLVEPGQAARELRVFFFLDGYIINFGFVAFAFVICATLSGFVAGYGILLLGKLKKKILDYRARR